MIRSIVSQLSAVRAVTSDRIDGDIPGETDLADLFFELTWNSVPTLPPQYDAFKPSILVSILNKYNIQVLLDASVGRGNRMIASLSEKRRYIGVYDYLPLKNVGTQALAAWKLPESQLTLLYGSFDTAAVGDYIVDAIILPLTMKNSPTQTCNWIIKAWNNLNPGKLLLVHSEFFTSDLRQLVERTVETLVGVSSSSAMIYELGDTGKLYVWRKTEQSVPRNWTSMTRKGDVLRSDVPLMKRAMGAYSRSLGTGLHYVCSSYVDDEGIISLCETVPSGTITVYIKNEPRKNKMVDTIASLGYDVARYTSTSDNVYATLKEDLPPSDTLLPLMFDDPLFEACLVQALRASLPQEGQALVQFDRVWLETDYLVLIRALLYVWPRTTLLLSVNGSPEIMRKDISLDVRGRTIIYKKYDHKSRKTRTLEQMRGTLGYKEDIILHQ